MARLQHLFPVWMEESRFLYLNWIKENYSVDFVDTITEPGVDKVVANNSDLESIKTKIGISINAHKSKLVVVSGHYDCAANPVSDEEHILL